MELFEEGADFVEILSRYFVGSHGQRLKTSYADALTHLLLPVAKVGCPEPSFCVPRADACTPPVRLRRDESSHMDQGTGNHRPARLCDGQ